MGRKLCIANQSAGVGKTTTSVNLATALARAGHRTLVVDVDPRRTTERCLATAAGPQEPGRPQRSYVKGCDLAAVSDLSLSTVEASHPLDHLTQSLEYDYVVIDCPPTLADATQCAMIWADQLLVPLRCDPFGMDGIAELVGAMKAAIAAGSQLEFTGVLLTHREPGDSTAEIEQETRDFFGDVMFETTVPTDASLDEARRSRQAVMDVAPRSRATRAYLELCREVLDR